MDSLAINLPSPGRRRGRYSDAFKADIVAACKAPGISTAAVALANGLNANLVRRWVAESNPTRSTAAKAQRGPTVAAPGASPFCAPESGFVPLALGTASTDIRVELRKGDQLVTLYWPMSAATQCLAALQDWLR
jgi:transposase